MLSLIGPVLLGAVVGGLIGHFGACASGACPLMSSWWRGALYGATLGLMVSGVKR